MISFNIFNIGYETKVKEKVEFEAKVKKDFRKLPDVLFSSIMHYLPSEDVVNNCALVNKNWKTKIHRCVNWRQYIRETDGGNYFEHFSRLVEKGILQWEEVPAFISVQDLLSRVIQRWQKEHGQYDGELLAKQGNLECFNQGKNVVIRKMGENNCKTLPRVENAQILDLLLDGENLFADGSDGIITQWNVKTCKVVQKIETAYFKKHFLIEKSRNEFRKKSRKGESKI